MVSGAGRSTGGESGGRWKGFEGVVAVLGEAGSACSGRGVWMRGGREKDRVAIVLVRLTVFVARTAAAA